MDPYDFANECTQSGSSCSYSWGRCEKVEGVQSLESVVKAFFDAYSDDGLSLEDFDSSNSNGGQGSGDAGGPTPPWLLGGSNLTDPFYPDMCFGGELHPALCPGKGCGTNPFLNPCSIFGDFGATCINSQSGSGAFICTCSSNMFDETRLCLPKPPPCADLPINENVTGTWDICNTNQTGCHRLVCPTGKVAYDENGEQFDAGPVIAVCDFNLLQYQSDWVFENKFFKTQLPLTDPVSCGTPNLCARTIATTDFKLNLCQISGDLRATCTNSGSVNTCDCSSGYDMVTLSNEEAASTGVPQGSKHCQGSLLARSDSIWKQYDALPAPRHLYSSCWMGTNYYIYGGSSGPSGEYNDEADLWEYKSETKKWRIIYADDYIPGRLGTFGAKMYCDSAQSRLILFGGSDSERFFNELWYFYLGDLSWVLAGSGDKSESAWPSARREFGMTARSGVPRKNNTSDGDHTLFYIVAGYGEFGVCRDIWEIDIGPTQASIGTFYDPVAVKFTGIPDEWLGGQGLVVHYYEPKEMLLTYGGLTKTNDQFGFPVVVNDLWTYTLADNTWALINITNAGMIPGAPSLRHNFGSTLVGEFVPSGTNISEPKGRGGKVSVLAKKGIFMVFSGQNSLKKTDIADSTNLESSIFYLDLATFTASSDAIWKWEEVKMLTSSIRISRASYDLLPVYTTKSSTELELKGFSLFGGLVGSIDYNDLLLLTFDTSKGTYSWILQTRGIVSRQPSPRAYHCTARFGSDLYIFGGVESDRTVLKDLWQVDMDSQKWKRVTAAINGPSARFRHACAATSFKMVVFGGIDGTKTPLSDVWMYNVLTKQWSQVEVDITNPGPSALYDHTMVTLFNNNKALMYVFGGVQEEDADPIQQSLWVFDPDLQSWTQKLNSSTWTAPGNQTKADLTRLARAGHAAAVYRTTTSAGVTNAQMIVFGGTTEAGLDNGIFLYDPKNDSWSFRNVSDSLPAMKKAVMWTSGSNVFVQGGQLDTLLNQNLLSGVIEPVAPAITSQAIFVNIPASYTTAGYLAGHSVNTYQNRAVVFGGYSSTFPKNKELDQPVGKPRAVQNNLQIFTSLPVCPLNAAKTSQKSGVCVLCEAGSFANLTNITTGTYSCISCPKGSYSVKDGSGVCVLCPPGFYSVLSGASNAVFCTACEAGTLARLPGSSFCEKCPTNFSCPLASLAAVRNTEKASSIAFAEVQPAPLERRTEWVSDLQLKLQYAAIGVVCISFVVGFFLLLIGPCRYVIKALDIFKDKHVPTSVQDVQQKKRSTAFGGVFTICFCTVAILFFVRTLVPLYDNKQEVRALFGLVKKTEQDAFQAGRIELSIEVQKYSDVCINSTDPASTSCDPGIGVQLSGFNSIRPDRKPGALLPEATALLCVLNTQAQTCKITWRCLNCQVNPKAGAHAQFMLDHLSTDPADVDRMYTQAIVWNVSTTSGVTLKGEDKQTQDQISSLKGTIVPVNPLRLLRGPIPSVITSSLTQTFFSDTYIHPPIEGQGYTTSFVSDTTGSEVDSRSFSQNNGLRVTFRFEVFQSGLSVVWSTITPPEVLLSAALGAATGLLAPFGIALVLFEFVSIYMRIPFNKKFAEEYQRVKDVQRGRTQAAKAKLAKLTAYWKKNGAADLTGNAEPLLTAEESGRRVSSANPDTGLLRPTLEAVRLDSMTPNKDYQHSIDMSPTDPGSSSPLGSPSVVRSAGLFSESGSVCKVAFQSATLGRDHVLSFETPEANAVCEQCHIKFDPSDQKAWHCAICSFTLCEPCHGGIFGRQLMCSACSRLFGSDGTTAIAKTCHDGAAHNLVQHFDCPGTQPVTLAESKRRSLSEVGASTDMIDSSGQRAKLDVFCTACGLAYATAGGQRIVPKTCWDNKPHILAHKKAAPPVQASLRNRGTTAVATTKGEGEEEEEATSPVEETKQEIMDLAADVEIPDAFWDSMRDACIIA
eukprot:gb/GEZN01000140.1/.p1 GENE.gb/GEZN01000140.1/~~gb/GEZN01000140.1/.p1  ORF type:complete len:2060 (-),score=190.17 gb/GEZN01000140.1/:397-6201(-)